MIEGRESGKKDDDKEKTAQVKDNDITEAGEFDVHSVDEAMENPGDGEVSDNPVDDKLGELEDEQTSNDRANATTEERDDEGVREADEPADGGKEENQEGLTYGKYVGGDAQSNGQVVRLIDITSYEENLLKLSKVLPTEEQIAGLDCAANKGPNFIGRTASRIRGLKFGQHHKKSNGYTTLDILLPAADLRNSKHCSHQHLIDGECCIIVTTAIDIIGCRNTRRWYCRSVGSSAFARCCDSRLEHSGVEAEESHTQYTLITTARVKNL
jgi:hypothetical protein